MSLRATEVCLEKAELETRGGRNAGGGRGGGLRARPVLRSGSLWQQESSKRDAENSSL